MINPPTSIFIDKSPIHGWGVFAKTKILKDSIIEETPYIFLFNKGEEELEVNKNMLFDYRFSYPADTHWKEQVIPMGYGCVYNHSNDPNAFWETDTEKKTFRFKALRDIIAGEEIFTYYGPSYYWNHREHVNLK